MTLFLLSSSDGPLLASDSAVIKKDDRQYFDDAQEMLAEIKSLKSAQQQENEAAAATAHAQSSAHFQQEAEKILAEQISSLDTRIEQVEQQRRSDIAQSAFAAVNSIIGSQTDEQVMQALVDKLLEQFEDQRPTKIHVHPDMQAQLATSDALQNLEVVGDPLLARTDCHLFTASSKLVADLSLQLNTLAERWGVDEAEAGGAE